MSKRVIFISGILAFLFLNVCMWRYAPTSTAAEVALTKSLPVVSVIAAKSGSIGRSIELDGTVEAARIARMSSPAEGPIGYCDDNSVREGDHVKKGQTLICIGRDKSINALWSATQSDLKREQDELERVKKLVENGAIPGDQLGIASAKYENAKAQLARVEESRKDYQITAPWSGIVSKVMVVEGDYVAPRTPLIEIFDPASLVVRFAVPEADAQTVSAGKNLSVTLDAYPGKTFSARINRVYPKLDPGTRTRLAEAAVSEKIALMPGFFARIKLNVQTRDKAVIVPAEAVLVNATGARVAFVVQASKAIARKVVTGIESGRMIEIVSGVKPGEQVVVAGNEKLKDGMAVKLLEKKGGSDVKKVDDTKPASSSTKGTAQ